MNSLKLTSAALVACFGLSSLNATVLYLDDFESYSVGIDQRLNTSPTNDVNMNVADETLSTVFGDPNQFGYLDGGSSYARADVTASLMTWSFDMYEPTTAQTGITRFGIGNYDVNDSRGYVAWSINNGVIAMLDNTAQVSGALPTLDVEKLYTTYIIYNGSGSAQTVAGSGITLQDGEVALYFYDVAGSNLISAGIYDTTAANAPSAFLIRQFSSDQNTLYFDNITLDDSLAVIPEPSAYAAMFGCAALAILMRRKRAA